MTINDNSTKSINAAIIDLQNQIKQLQYKIDILNKNQLKEDDIEFPGKVEYADEAGKAKEADHAKTADTAKYTSETENAVHAGYADIATKATQDGSGNVITDTYATKTELTSGLSGKANTSHNHSAADITSGTLAVERGGTGQTTQADINKAIVGELSEGNDVVTDGTMFVSSWASDNGFADTNAVNVPYKRKFSRVWEYIKGKISSVLGLSTDGLSSKGNITAPDNKFIRAICASNDYVQIVGSGTSDSGSGEISTGDNGNEPLYARQRDTSNNVTHEITLLDASGNQKFNTVTASSFVGNLSGKASTAGTADYANALTYRGLIQNTDTFQSEMKNDGKWIITDLYPGWSGSLYTFNAGGSQSGLMFRILGGGRGPSQVQINYSIDSSRFGMNWGIIINSENIGNYINPLKERISALESKIQ